MSQAPLDAAAFRLSIKHGLSRAIDASGMHRDDVVTRVAVETGRPFTRRHLDLCLDPSATVDLSLVRFKAMARGLGAAGLWSLAMAGDFEIGAQLRTVGRLQAQIARIDAMLGQPDESDF